MKKFLSTLFICLIVAITLYYRFEVMPYENAEQITETTESETEFGTDTDSSSTCDHAYMTYAAKEPTSTQKGHTSYKKCLLCNNVQGYREFSYTYPCLDMLPSAYDRISIFNLSDKDKNEIMGMYLTVMSFGENYNFQSEVSKAQMDQYLDILCYSLPETFMITRQTKYSTLNGNIASVLFNYGISKDKYTTMMSEIEGKAKTLINAVKGKSDVDKVIYFNNYLIEHCTYTKEGENIRNIYGALTNREILCDGFADITNFLCNASGVKCQSVCGSTSESHAWNIVQIDGKYYYLDVTHNNNDRYNTPQYIILGASRKYIESMGYTIDENYTSIVPKANSDYNFKNRYVVTVTANKNFNTELANIAGYIVKNKPQYVYINFERQSDYDNRNDYFKYLYGVLNKSYPSAKIQNFYNDYGKYIALMIDY